MKLVRELLEFERGLDPREAMGVGLKTKIEKWIKDTNIGLDYAFTDKLHLIFYSNINLNFDSQIEGFPDFIKIDEVNGSVRIVNCFRFESLENFPKVIHGDLEFRGNAVRLTEKKIKELGIQVDGDIKLLDPQKQAQRDANKRYRSKGPVKQRTQHEFTPRTDSWGTSRKVYSGGYKVYKVLEFIRDAGPEGIRRKEIVKFLYEMGHGEGSAEGVDLRGWGSTTWFSGEPSGSILKRYTTLLSPGIYAINDKGLEAIEKYKKLFKE